MEILGIGPGEFILILIILLVAVGPERLPIFARQAGKMLVQVRNWIQKSPDAAMVLRARQEIEQELAVLRSSLMEVQNVRNEVLEAAKQVTTSVTDDVLGEFRQGYEEIKGVTGTVGRSLNGPIATLSADDQTTAVATIDRPVEPMVTLIEPQLPPDPVSSIATPVGTNGAVIVPDSASVVVGTEELAQLRMQLQILTNDLHELRQALVLRGLLDEMQQAASDSTVETITAPTDRSEE